MEKNITIYTTISNYNDPPMGAVDVCNHSIITDFIESGHPVKLISVPKGSHKIALMYKNIILIMKILYSLISSKTLVFIYPTVPFVPTTTTIKYHFSNLLYNIIYQSKVLFKFNVFTYILDYPIQQDIGLEIENIRINHKYLEKFEERLLGHSDQIITYSHIFSTMTIKKVKNASKKIIQFDFSPVKKRKSYDRSIDLCIIEEFVKRYKSVIFYSGDLSRNFEKNLLMSLFNKINDNVAIILCGNNGDWISNYDDRQNINYLGFLDIDKHDYISSLCSFGIILYPNKGYYKVTPTTKLSSYINSELPILAIQTETNRPIFDKYSIGECVEESKIIDRIIQWSEELIYNNYKESLKSTSDLINSKEYFDKVNEKLRCN